MNKKDLGIMNNKSVGTKLTSHWEEELQKRIKNGDKEAKLPMPPKEIAERIILECFESEEMKDHLLAHPEVLSARKLSDIIAGALLPLSKKAELIKAVDNAAYLDIKEALDALDLKPGQFFIFSLEGTEIRDGHAEPDSECVGPCTNLEKIRSYFRRNYHKLPEGENLWEHRLDTDWWVSLELYEPKEGGEFFNSYTYYMIADEICFFDKSLSMRDDDFYSESDSHYSWEGVNLNISIPFKPGDIVTIDGRPFCDVKHVVLIDVGGDCCGVQAIYKGADGQWGIGAVKHGMVYDGYTHPMLSPLYRLEKYDGKIKGDDYFLESISLDYKRNLRDAYKQGLIDERLAKEKQRD